VTPKQRVVAALEHREPDRVPTGENQVDGALVEGILGRRSLYNAGWRELEALWSGRRDELVADYGTAHVDLARALRWDFVRVPAVPAAGEHPRPRMTGPHSWLDETGREVVANPDVGNIAVRESTPDMTLDDLPDPDASVSIDPSQLAALRHVVEELGDTHFIVARSPADGTFPWEDTVGMEEFLVRMITDPAFVHRAVDAAVARSCAWIDALLDTGADAVMTTDDYCDNRGPVMGVERFREFVLPGLRRQCERVHARGGYFIKHTDGYLWDVLDDFVDIGIDGWHGIQPAIGMDFARLQERYGGRLCLFGGVDCETLINGPASRAREQVRYAIEHAGPGGGLVIATSNVLQPGTELDYYLAMRQAVDDFGMYSSSA
jgi:uroporphyrinogen decarboxylase